MPALDIPEGFVELERLSPYIAAMGPFHHRREGERFVFGLRVQEKHINTRGFVHGGVLCSLADIAIGYNISYAETPPNPPMPVVTANLSLDFTGSARLGDWLDVRVDIQRRGGRLSFASAFIWRGEERIARASAIFARLEKREG